MNCIYHKVRSKKGKKYGYCTLLRNEVTIFNCKCSSIVYKVIKPIKSRTKKQIQKEKNRFSIIYTDLTKCAICGSKIGINKHEVFYGRNRQNSIKYGLIVPLCFNHHTDDNGIHKNRELDLHFKKLFQKKWIETYGTNEDFIKTFHQNYTLKYKKVSKKN